MKTDKRTFNEKYKKEEFEKLIFKDKVSYNEMGRTFGVSATYIKKVANRLGINLPVRAKFPDGFKPVSAGKVKKVTCENCGKTVRSSHNQQKYCSNKCSADMVRKNSYKNYLENQEEYCRVRSMRFIKPYLLKEQDCKCKICQMPNIWNDKQLVFTLDHIDGDAANNLKENLRLICPNCDSQLDTYKSKNKNSARKDRYLRNYKN